MATLILGGIGSLIGGPVGGALGALAGRQIDAAIIGGPKREGARLKDLSITTSSYGTPIARHFGAMRTAGSIIWSTELAENSETSGGKGKPKVTTYSYSSSFAVALASRPIIDIGRIWADGNLLRGAAGDLKVGGTMRLYRGYGDQPVDPLIAAAQGASCPAFRNSAYVVFEDLQLEDFGNRIPALSFEIFADSGQFGLVDVVGTHLPSVASDRDLGGLSGMSYEGGRLGDVMAMLSAVYPNAIDATGQQVRLMATDPATSADLLAGTTIASLDEENPGAGAGLAAERLDRSAGAPRALRYYDTTRDYQPGVQRSAGRAGDPASATLELPAALDSQAARYLIESASGRASARRETLRWRIAELDPELGPGRIVRLADRPGQWVVDSWEWRETGVELQLVRQPPRISAGGPGTPGELPLPPDTLPMPTWLRAFELPWDGTGLSSGRQVFAAAASASENWSGAALYADRGSLDPVATTGSRQAVMGTLAADLGTSQALFIEPDARMHLDLASRNMVLAGGGVQAISAGRNRLCVGDEIIQFAEATQVSETRWTLSGLLRGRGATEPASLRGHPAGTAVTLIDTNLVPLGDQMALDGMETPLAAIGRGDAEPVIAPIENFGLGARPLPPVHCRAESGANGDLHLRWTRRARGNWTWDTAVETPLNEAFERYLVGVGPTEVPVAVWEIDTPELVLDATSANAHAGLPVWVRQIGNTMSSEAVLLTIL